VLVLVMYIVGINTYLCLTIGGASSAILIWQTFSLNRKYGEYGLMKLGAQKKHPKYIISRKKISRYLKSNVQKASV